MKPHTKTLGLALLLAAIILGVALVVRLDLLAALDNTLAQRCTGVIAGVLVMWFANVVPKKISAAGRGLATRRAVGWTMLLSGLGYTLAWLWLPLAYAADTAMALLGTGLAYCVWRILRCRADRTNRGQV